MSAGFNRRRFLQIAASAALLPASAIAAEPVFRWNGTALGAAASMTLAGVDKMRGEEIAARMQSEIYRLEEIFSLYRIGSAITQLNSEGRLARPPAELLELLTLCDGLANATDGAFDPTIQPLWRLYSDRAIENRVPPSGEIIHALGLTGWKHVTYSPAAISFRKPGMAITLNGIAQGYMTDRIAGLLRAEGLGNILVDIGEIRANGQRPDGTPWRAGVSDPAGRIVKRMQLRDRALATSAPLGTFVNRKERIGHILNPRTGADATQWKLVSVSAPTAAIADGLSTAFCMMPREQIREVLAAYPQTKIEILEASRR